MNEAINLPYFVRKLDTCFWLRDWQHCSRLTITWWRRPLCRAWRCPCRIRRRTSRSRGWSERRPCSCRGTWWGRSSWGKMLLATQQVPCLSTSRHICVILKHCFHLLLIVPFQAPPDQLWAVAVTGLLLVVISRRRARGHSPPQHLLQLFLHLLLGRRHSSTWLCYYVGLVHRKYWLGLFGSPGDC